MIRNTNNKKKGVNDENVNFKHYKVIVKILHEDKIEHQNLEIFTTGLKQLLEMRRLHNKAFNLGFKCLLETTRNN
jgi:hypothetical protein